MKARKKLLKRLRKDIKLAHKVALLEQRIEDLERRMDAKEPQWIDGDGTYRFFTDRAMSSDGNHTAATQPAPYGIRVDLAQ